MKAARVKIGEFEFFSDENGYVYLEGEGRPGTLGTQICDDGGFRGNTVSISHPDKLRKAAEDWLVRSGFEHLVAKITESPFAENPPDDWEECGCCECYHPPGFAGDCRDDENRWPDPHCIMRLHEEHDTWSDIRSDVQRWIQGGYDAVEIADNLSCQGEWQPVYQTLLMLEDAELGACVARVLVKRLGGERIRRQ